ncbi:Lipase/esterase [Pleurostoma richardsiae]|uniref:Lipase/esterase n=1 Tax=Pleurostoma richardsiae TaxID=41990 RepID=A0AA38RN49_9PEZI|nr:Lipase/esterase [Pleurostoma richardsiae]
MASTDGEVQQPLVSAENIRMLLEFLPKVPHLVRVALLHVLGLSKQSQYRGLQTELIIATIRAFLNPSRPKSVTETQRIIGKDPGIKGRIWVSKYAAPAPPETSVRDALVKAIDALRHEGTPGHELQLPETVPVEAEWTAYRAGVATDARLPPISEKEKYDEMMKECKNPTTILYFHGGAYWLMDPATHRPSTKRLAKLTGGRCYSVRYRLAPQNPFPAALLDALVSYLTLLYPPPGAFHEAVKPEHIVISGDSAGGNLSLALLQLLLELRRQDIRIRWFGEERDIPLPAGVATSSPWVDLTHSSPSWETNGEFDYLPVPKALDIAKLPPCPAWPATPPRKALYVADALLTHPLVTLSTARSWKGAPPVYMCTGWEMLADEDKYMAAKLHRDGVPVVFEEYEAMPHCFALLLEKLPGSRRCLEGWTGFIMQAVQDPSGIKSSFRTVKAKTLEEVELDPKELCPFTEEEVRERVFQRAKEDVAAEDAVDAIAKL